MEIKIYTLASSQNPDEIKYVGKTKQSLKRRLQGHICCAKKAKKSGNCTNHNYNWINYILDNGYEIIIEELDSIIISENESWDWIEQYWICQLKDWGFSLTNIRKGGEDNYYSKPTEEVIKERAQKIIGIPRSEKTKKKISTGLKNREKSDSTIEKIRESISKKQGRPVLQYSMKMEFIKEWNTGKEAAKELGLDSANLNNCCHGKRKSCGGFIWKFKEETPPETRIIQLSLDNKYLNTFANSVEASKDLNINQVLINNVCRGIQEQTYNYKFKYYNDYYNVKN